MVSSADLSTLLSLASRGDQDAFGRFYDATSHRVFGMALSVVGDRGGAQALTQEVYVSAWKSAPSFDASCEGAGPWLVAIAGAEMREASKQRPIPDPL